jgi:hypothetical protein
MALTRQRASTATGPKWREVRRVTPNPSWSKRHQPACKPGSVGQRLLTQTIRDGHSSGTTFARCLEQPTRTTSLTSLLRRYRFRELPALSSLFGLAPGGVYRAGSVAETAVRSYRTFSPLLPPSLARMGEAVRFLWHCPWGCPRRTLSGTVCRWSPDFPPPRAFRRLRERPSGRLTSQGMGAEAPHVKRRVPNFAVNPTSNSTSKASHTGDENAPRIG